MDNIPCVKVMKNTEAAVIKNKLYYSNGHPEKEKFKNVTTIFLIGEIERGGIPLIGTCDVVIKSCTSIHKDFEGMAKGEDGWNYEWELLNVDVKNRILDIRTYIEDEKDKKSITNLQKTGYIDSSNLNLAKLGMLIGNNSIVSTIPNKSQSIISQISKKQKYAPLQKNILLEIYSK